MQPVYLDHFGLRRAPFDLMPQGDFLFNGLSFKRALDALRHIVGHEPGVTVVTGEIGVGKTLLAKSLLASLPEGVDAVFLDNPTFSPDEILQALADVCEVPIREGKRQALAALRQAAAARRAQGRTLTILIDEAHLMPPESVEEVRLLTNLEQDGGRLFSIILIGQPELKDELLARHDMRQVRDRVKYWLELPPMPSHEAGVYLDHRLRQAGWSGAVVFPPPIVRSIWRASGGRPRRINLIADRCLLAAYLDGVHQVDRNQLAKALAEIDPEDTSTKPALHRRTLRRASIYLLATALLLAIGVSIGLFFHVGAELLHDRIAEHEVASGRHLVEPASVPTANTAGDVSPSHHDGTHTMTQAPDSAPMLNLTHELGARR